MVSSFSQERRDEPRSFCCALNDGDRDDNDKCDFLVYPAKNLLHQRSFHCLPLAGSVWVVTLHLLGRDAPAEPGALLDTRPAVCGNLAVAGCAAWTGEKSYSRFSMKHGQVSEATGQSTSGGRISENWKFLPAFSLKSPGPGRHWPESQRPAAQTAVPWMDDQESGSGISSGWGYESVSPGRQGAER